MSYQFPSPTPTPRAEPGVVWTVASGDLRPAANVTCWPTQAQLESDVTAAVTALGWRVQRGHEFDEAAGHGFIDSQRAGIEVFKHIPPDAPLIVVEAVWQYSHHVLAGLRSHQGPILLVANWSGQFPGLVGLLNLAGSLTKAGVDYSALWSPDFTDEWARDGLKTWLTDGSGRARHQSRPRPAGRWPSPTRSGWVGAWPPSCEPTRPSSVCSTRAAWACTTRSSTTSTSTRWASTRNGSRSRRWWPR